MKCDLTRHTAMLLAAVWGPLQAPLIMHSHAPKASRRTPHHSAFCGRADRASINLCFTVSKSYHINTSKYVYVRIYSEREEEEEEEEEEKEKEDGDLT